MTIPLSFSPEEILQAPADIRRALLEDYLCSAVGAALGVAGDAVPRDQSILELGFDSIMIMDLVVRIEKDFPLKIHPRELFEQPSVACLARYLADETQGSTPPAAISQEELLKAMAPWTRSRSHATAAASPPVPGVALLLSAPRSGSTLLRVMLAGHPGLFCPPELHLLPFDSLRDRLRVLWGTYLQEGLERAFLELKGGEAAAVKKELEALAESGMSIQAVYAELHKLIAPRLLIDKSPSYALDEKTLQHAEILFDQPKYIHLVRHPHAAVESFVRNRFDRLLGVGHIDATTAAEQVWLFSNRNLLSFAKKVGPDRFSVVRYEDLVADPDATMRGLCTFLGVPFDAAVLEPYGGGRMTDGLHPNSIGVGDPSFLARDEIDPNLRDAWRTVRLERGLCDEVGQLALDLGYEMPSGAGIGTTADDAAFETGSL